VRLPSLTTVSSPFNFSEARLVGGNSCRGRLEIRPDTTSPFGQACDLNNGDNEAMVVCRMLGCDPIGAERIDASE
jgi:hypothetical protein